LGSGKGQQLRGRLPFPHPWRVAGRLERFDQKEGPIRRGSSVIASQPFSKPDCAAGRPAFAETATA